MPSTFLLRSILLTLLIVSFPAAQSQTPPKSMSRAELIALVAGNALSENIVHEIQSRGIAFTPTEDYKSLLRDAGADSAVIGALNAAKVTSKPGPPGSQSDTDLLKHLAMAGKLLRGEQYEQATTELTAALEAGAEPEAGFVMGEVLRRQEQFDLAAEVYQKVLEANSGFPEAHTKLAFSFYRAGDQEHSMQQAKLALALNPANAEAHKNLGLPLMALNQFDASIAEYREALRIKPDYAAVHYNLGLVFYARHDRTNAIAEYRKSIALDPGKSDVHYNLSFTLKESGDIQGAIREYRETRRLDPSRIDARQNLGLALIDVDIPAAIREFRELVEMAPDFELGHNGLGLALSNNGDLKAAEVEYRKASALDPSDSIPHSNLGFNLEKQQKYDDAMNEFLQAARLDNSSARAHFGMGEVYLHRREYSSALRELRLAETINTNLSNVHSRLAEALTGSGDLPGAIAEKKQALLFEPKTSENIFEFGQLLEKSGDTGGALEQYRLAAESCGCEKMSTEYAAAQKRLASKVSAPQIPSSTSAVPREAANHAVSNAVTEPQWRATLDASEKALSDRRYPEAESTAKTAVAMAEKLGAHDRKLMESIFQMAVTYTTEKKYSEARDAWQQYLKVSQEVEGPESLETIKALSGLAGISYYVKDFASAANFYSRAIELEQKLLGPGNPQIIFDLYALGQSYQALGSFEKAEAIFLQLLKENTAHGSGGYYGEGDLLLVAKLYRDWGKLDKSELYCRKSLAARESSYGDDSPLLAQSLEVLSDVLARQGKNEEAATIKQRRDKIMAQTGSAQTSPQ
ncbi:MAG TPA: tetratricopeptide repeat protein [Candidatus Angelobacter sp.]|nr:tetratricopeptide repeat protein [Candidatus Angelobacter sp.]